MKYCLLYGGMSGLIAISVIVAGLAFDAPSHVQSQWFGYLVMLVALSLIFVGTKRYRDVECGGVIGFGRAVAIGLGISVVASVMYVIGWEAYLALSGRDFIAEFAAGELDAMRRSGATAAAIEVHGAKLRELLDNYANPLFRWPVTFAEIFPVGLVVSLISAAVLRDPRVLAVRGPR